MCFFAGSLVDAAGCAGGVSFAQPVAPITQLTAPMRAVSTLCLVILVDETTQPRGSTLRRDRAEKAYEYLGAVASCAGGLALLNGAGQVSVGGVPQNLSESMVIYTFCREKVQIAMLFARFDVLTSDWLATRSQRGRRGESFCS